MKTPIAAVAVAFTLLMAPAAAFAQHRGPHPGPVHVQKQVVVQKKVVVHRHVVRKPVVVKHRWVRGRPLPAHYRRHVVTDYHRYHLHRPGPGQRWVRVDNQYILINTVTGMIAALSAMR